MHGVDLEEFKYGGTNITAFRLVDPEKPEIQRVVRDWQYGEARFGRKLEMPASAVRVNLITNVFKTQNYDYGSLLAFLYLCECV